MKWKDQIILFFFPFGPSSALSFVSRLISREFMTRTSIFMFFLFCTLTANQRRKMKDKTCFRWVHYARAFIISAFFVVLNLALLCNFFSHLTRHTIWPSVSGCRLLCAYCVQILQIRNKIAPIHSYWLQLINWSAQLCCGGHFIAVITLTRKNKIKKKNWMRGSFYCLSLFYENETKNWNGQMVNREFNLIWLTRTCARPCVLVQWRNVIYLSAEPFLLEFSISKTEVCFLINHGFWRSIQKYNSIYSMLYASMPKRKYCVFVRGKKLLNCIFVSFFLLIGFINSTMKNSEQRYVRVKMEIDFLRINSTNLIHLFGGP